MRTLTLAPENIPESAVSAQLADGFFGRFMGLMRKNPSLKGRDSSSSPATAYT